MRTFSWKSVLARRWIWFASLAALLLVVAAMWGDRALIRDLHPKANEGTASARVSQTCVWIPLAQGGSRPHCSFFDENSQLVEVCDFARQCYSVETSRALSRCSRNYAPNSAGFKRCTEWSHDFVDHSWLDQLLSQSPGPDPEKK